MQNLVDFISQPWPWYVSGPLISLIMFSLLYFGKRFGMSSNFKTICSMAGAGKHAEFFRIDWKKDVWNLIFILGAVVGGAIGHYYLGAGEVSELHPEIVAELASFGISSPGESYIPVEIFSWQSLFTTKGIVMMIVGGFLVGFGTRYADGCTSGHAISGLSNFQLSSLTAVVGFFIGGLLITYFVLPYILIL